MDAHSRHETADYTSKLYMSQNNLFGMKCPRIRPNLGSCNDRNGFQAYKTKADSIKDLQLWFDYNDFPREVDSVEEYANILKNMGYFEAPVNEYIQGMKRFIK